MLWGELVYQRHGILQQKKYKHAKVGGIHNINKSMTISYSVNDAVAYPAST